jgi:hypothetical protein
MPNKFKNKSKPIFRAEYHCLGGCDAKSPSEESDSDDSSTTTGSDSDADSESDDGGRVTSIHNQLKSNSIPKKKARKSGRCPYKVKLHVSL